VSINLKHYAHPYIGGVKCTLIGLK